MRCYSRCSMQGFTLMELMIVVAIVAMLASIALPSYQKQVRDSRRTDAVSALLIARQAMERHYSKNYSYTDAEAGTTFVNKSPIDGATVYYNLVLNSDAATYTITATPAGPQAGDKCGNLTIDQTGAKGHAGTASFEECWQ